MPTRCSPIVVLTNKTVATPGMVLHSEDCEREWLILSSESLKKYDRKGVYAALYFDKDNDGRGVDAVLLGQDIITLHISTVGLVRSHR